MDKKSFLNAIKKRVYKSTPIGVVDQAIKYGKDKKAQKKSEKNLKELNKKLVIQRAQNAYKKKYNKKMSPSTLKADLDSGVLGEETKSYLKEKKKQTKLRKKEMEY